MGYNNDIYRGVVVKTEIGYFYKRKFTSLLDLFEHEDIALFRLKSNGYEIVDTIVSICDDNQYSFIALIEEEEL